MKKSKLEEGTLFLVPLDDGRWSVGVLARKSPKRGTVQGIYAYFFGPFESKPEFSKLGRLLQWENAATVLKCSALHLHEGSWPIVGKLDRWDRRDWPLVGFLRIDVQSKKNYCVKYDDDDVYNVISETETTVPEGLIPDRSSGARAAEIHLSRAMGSSQKLN